MRTFWKLIDKIRNRKNTAGKFIYKNKIWTISVYRKDKKEYFRLHRGLKKYLISITSAATINKRFPKNIGYFLEEYLKCNDNWEWLLKVYNGTGHLNERLSLKLEMPNYSRM